jgi:phosphohistidine phosphatase
MSTLVILRHAEAIPSRANDHARQLTPRGRADAAAIGAALRTRLTGPVLVLASDAQRTVETAELAFPTDAAVEIRTTAALYDASPATLLQAVQGVPGPQHTLVVVGHNPGLSDFAKQLAGTASAGDRARLEAGMPTAAAALYDVAGAWSAVALRGARVIATLAPEGQAWPG